MGDGRINNLPLEIRNHIISFLPLKDAMRTCILSKQWRNVCMYLSSMDFEFVGNDRSKFRDFVNEMLLRHGGFDIEKFKLVVSLDGTEEISSQQICSWISFALRHNVKILELCVGFNVMDKFPYDFYTCSGLKVLILWSTRVEWSSFLKFDVLEKLYIEQVSFSNGDTIHNLVSNVTCPVLNYLDIRACSLGVDVLQISNCSLRSVAVIDDSMIRIVIKVMGLTKLEYSCWTLPNICSKTLGSLLDVDIEFRINDEINSDDDINNFHWIRKFVLGLSNVKWLTVNSPFMEFFSLGRHQLLSPVILKNLNVKHFCVGLFKSNKHIRALQIFLAYCNCLEVLEVTISEQGWDWNTDQLESKKSLEDERYWERKEFCNKTILPSLRRVEIKQFGGENIEDLFVKYILMSCRSLTELEFSYPYDSPDRVRSERRRKKKLSEYRKMAPQISISIT